MTSELLIAACCCGDEVGPPCDSSPTCYAELPDVLSIRVVGFVQASTSGGTSIVVDFDVTCLGLLTPPGSFPVSGCAWGRRQDETAVPDPPVIFGTYVESFGSNPPTTRRFEHVPPFPDPLRDDVIALGCDPDDERRRLTCFAWASEDGLGRRRLGFDLRSVGPAVRDPRDQGSWVVANPDEPVQIDGASTILEFGFTVIVE